MFKRNTDRIVWWPVEFNVATDDGVQCAQFRARFRLWSSDRVQDDQIEQAQVRAAILHNLMGDVSKRSTEEITATADNGLALTNMAVDRSRALQGEVLDAVVDWADILDDLEQPVPFSRAALEGLFRDYPTALEGFLDALRTASKPTGALTKN